MSDISRKTIGQLIDELITANIKIYMTMEREIAAQGAKNYRLAGELGEQVLNLNVRRRQLINAIDGEETVSRKSYEE